MEPLLKLHEATLDELKKTKTLLAFSAGVDSTALFFLLRENGVFCDIAIVDYGLREQSKQEVIYAKKLASTYKINCFLHEVNINSRDFESIARKERYEFFEQIIQENNYNILLTAHHLGDRLEWFLMQLCKGAGLNEILGMQEIEERNFYKLIRPLLDIDKSQLYKYLQKNNIQYFEDESNNSLKYHRNYFRHNISNPLLERYKDGIAKSFSYLQADKNILQTSAYKQIKQLYIVEKSNPLTQMRTIDKLLKQSGFCINSHLKKEFINEKSHVVSNEIAVCFNEKNIFIAPYLHDIVLPKKIKELFRIAKIPKQIRQYLYKEDIYKTLTNQTS